MVLKIDYTDYHVAGESLRILTGLKEIDGQTMAERAEIAQSLLRTERALATQEPRGHADLFAAFLTPPVSQAAAFGALICDGVLDSKFKGTCGHGSIALAAAALERGWVSAPAGNVALRLDLPAGEVELDVEWDGRRAGDVTYSHVPSHVAQMGIKIGEIEGDMVMAGPKVFLVDATAANIAPSPQAAFAAYRQILATTSAQTAPDLVQFRWGPWGDIRSFTLFGPAGYDRSPCGTASSALALWATNQGLVAQGEWFTNTTLLGSRFQARLDTRDLPQIRARAYMAGQGQLILQSDDPFRLGVAAPGLIAS